jgi:hypothetical protein
MIGKEPGTSASSFRCAQFTYAMKRWLQLHIPIALCLFVFITIQRTVDSDGGFERVYGLPFAYITSNFGYSFHYEVYLLPLLADLATYLILTFVVIGLLEKAGIRSKSKKLYRILGTLVTIVLITFLIAIIHKSDFYAIENYSYKVIAKSIKVGVFP